MTPTLRTSSCLSLYAHVLRVRGLAFIGEITKRYWLLKNGRHRAFLTVEMALRRITPLPLRCAAAADVHTRFFAQEKTQFERQRLRVF